MTTVNSVKHVAALLQNSLMLTEITNKLKQLELINTLISSLLPKEVSENCVAANLREGVLVLVTNSPVWKYKLNFLKIDLLEQFRKFELLAGISSISIVIDYLKQDLYNQYLTGSYSISSKSNKIDNVNKIRNFKLKKATVLLVNKIIEQEITDQNLKLRFKNLIFKLQQD